MNKNIIMVVGIVFLVAMFVPLINGNPVGMIVYDKVQGLGEYEYVSVSGQTYEFDKTRIGSNIRHILNFKMNKPSESGRKVIKTAKLPFRYSPEELEEIPMEYVRSDILFAEVVYITRDKNLTEKILFLGNMGFFPKEISEMINTTPNYGYVIAKRFGENLCSAYNKESGLNVIIIRIDNTFGEGDDFDNYPQIIPRFIKDAMTKQKITVFGDGSNKRTFIYVKDLVRDIIDLASSNFLELKHRVYNLSSSEVLSLSNIAELIKEIFFKILKLDFGYL
mgnify:CR=1 FL=1